VTRPSPAAHVEARLSALLGPNPARTAVRTFCLRATGGTPEALRPDDAPMLLAALRPTLRTLLGAATAEHLLAEIARELA
jgi:hypothetical protein